MTSHFNPKAIPDPAKDQTTGPNMDHIYFTHSDRFPFERKEKDYSPVNAWWLGEAAFLAYCHPGFARMAFQLAGFPDFDFFNGPGTECMIASSKRAVIIAFRGTETSSLSFFHELATDLNTLPVPFPGGGTVHQGFFQALEEVWEEKDEEYAKKNPKHHTGLKKRIEELISDKPGRPIWVCGHSLGGALATLCFASIPEATGLYIYGAPRVGDEEFLKLMGDRPVFRIEHAGDPIPLVPPKIPGIDFNFEDTGRLIFINRKGDILPERPTLDTWSGLEQEKQIKEEEQSRELEISKAWEKLPEDLKALDKNLKQIKEHVKKSVKSWSAHLEEAYNEFAPSIEDHMPVYYAIKLWNLLIKR